MPLSSWALEAQKKNITCLKNEQSKTRKIIFIYTLAHFLPKEKQFTLFGALGLVIKKNVRKTTHATSKFKEKNILLIPKSPKQSTSQFASQPVSQLASVRISDTQESFQTIEFAKQSLVCKQPGS